MTTEPRFFDFLELAARKPKPRRQGLTCIGDEGDPIGWVRDMLDTWGDYVDSVKFVPALLMMPARIAEERVKLYRDFKLDVALDDPIFGIAYYQGKAEQLLRRRAIPASRTARSTPDNSNATTPRGRRKLTTIPQNFPR